MTSADPARAPVNGGNATPLLIEGMVRSFVNDQGQAQVSVYEQKTKLKDAATPTGRK